MSIAQPIIRFQAADVRLKLPQRRALKAFIAHKFAKARQPLKGLVYVFCSDAYLHKINQQFLKHDFLTDIITFPLHAARDPVEGEVYISIERVAENASTYSVTTPTELRRVIFHGALHLLGYKDNTKTDAALMKKNEELWLSEFERFHVEQLKVVNHK